MTDPTRLSRAAQAVRLAAMDAQAGHEYCQYKKIAAAALRAAADHDPDGNTTDEYDAGWRAAMDFIDAIAAELEGAQ